MGEERKRVNRHFKFETIQLHGGQEHPDFTTGARAVPIYQTSSHVFDNCNHATARFSLSDPGNIYSRLANPILDVSGQRMAQLEGGVMVLTTVSGATAPSYTFQNLTRAGDHIASSGHTYGGTYSYLTHAPPEYEVEAIFVDPFDLEVVEATIRDSVKAVFIETLGNPSSDIIDIERIASIVHWHQIPLTMDNVFTTPYFIRPIKYGADTVVYSATRFTGGHGTTVGGVIMDGGRFDWAASGKFPGPTELNASCHGTRFAQDIGMAVFVARIRVILLRDTGATLPPLHGFPFLQGLETPPLRVERHAENALKVMEYLKAHPQVEEAHHPSVSQDSIRQQLYKKHSPRGGGPTLTFEIRGGTEKARELIGNLGLFSLLADVADVKSPVIHPASATHSQINEKEFLKQGIRLGTIRLSIGIEHIDDVLEDLEEAFRFALQI